MWNFKDSIGGVKNALFQALESIPDFHNLNATDKGKVVDKNFKSMLTDLMEQFGFKPGEDYENYFRSNEPCADFVIYSKTANDLIKDLLNGKLTVVKEHSKVSKSGTVFMVKAHFKKLNQF